jgi:prepilin-type N-terminal cleavage/methylation domain-containing protein
MRIRYRQKGFSLVELMVAMSAGLVVIGAVVVFTIATAQSSTANIRSERVMQNLRNAMSLIEREIRRSGYNQKALQYAGQCASASGTCPTSSFNQLVVVSADCLVVSYDDAANSTSGSIDAGEYHGFRLVSKNGVGIIQANLVGSTAPDCSSDTDWIDVSDSTLVDVTDLTFTNLTTSGGCVQQATTSEWIAVQDIGVSITGRWVDPSTNVTTSRNIQESVRVKNDVVSTTKPSVCA